MSAPPLLGCAGFDARVCWGSPSQHLQSLFTRLKGCCWNSNRRHAMSRPSQICRLALIALAVGQHPFPVSAQTNSIPRPDSGPAVAMVISGGASLGVYEAGYTYILSEVLKRQGTPLSVATGASAGSGNALFAGLSSCTAANDLPTRDLGYRFWLPQQFGNLFQPDSSTPISALIATPGQAELRRL